MADDYCDLCDLALSTCVHGMPPPPPKPTPDARPPRTPRAPKQPRATGVRTRTASGASSSPARPASLRTDQSAFRPYILRLLGEEGSLETAEVMERLAGAMDEVLRDRDREKAPTGEVRWHAAARAERKAMMDEGLIVPAQPGIWELTPRGRAATS